ncbi:class I SAM-dependent methyltransferase [Desulfovibrio cuneatus]|uniref:class I SAM-dependent methyltransferase n=1 Tax=Desulfovibrio cuneatus TaxID=159728 RepID=UPI000423BB2E|nr:methyltransferase domain-containing protein [Desulfovibrio cuneatus]
MNEKIQRKLGKLESPVRLAELAPHICLDMLGLTPAKVFCDMGAGTGLFSFAASPRAAQVYSLELDADLLTYMQEKAAALGITNMHVVQGEENSLPLPAASCHAVLLCTVLHELEHPQQTLEQIRAVLRPGGTLGIIEFHKKATPVGPPEAVRVAEEDVKAQVQAAGFTLQHSRHLGENFYFLVFGV